MGRNRLKHNYKVKKTIVPNVCRIVEGGKECLRVTHCRGLCSRHHTHFLRWGLIEKLGAKTKFVYVAVSEYKVNKKVKSSGCRIIENGKACKAGVHGRGLCARHWLVFSRHDLLKKYGGVSRKDPKTFTVKKRIVKGICRIIENDNRCNSKAMSKGCCPKHYLRFIRSGIINKYGQKS